MPKIDYSETDKRLAVRIRAHTEFANFQLEDWIKDRLDVSSGARVLEIGCGNGNFFPVYADKVGAKGLVAGFDVSDSLLAAAQERAKALSAPALVLKWDFNHSSPFLDDEFDAVICPFAAYYAKDAKAWVKDAVRVTRSGGQVLLLGPASDNAGELYALNEAVSGVRHVEGTDYTTQRLENDFLPALRDLLGEGVKSEILDRRITFPAARDFAEYYLATWLYEKTIEKGGREYSLTEVEAKVSSRTLSKRVVVLEARA